MNKKINLLIALLGSFILYSCNEDKLDIPQQGVLSEDNFYLTDEDSEQAIAAVYNSWRSTYSGSGTIGDASWYCNGFFLKNMMADDMVSGGSRSDQTFIQEFNESAVTPTNGWVKSYYERLYNTIYLSNLILEKYEGNTEITKRNIAEAKCLRALCNFELVTLWGTAPLVDHVLTASEYEIGNSTESQMWSFIEKDLSEAISSGSLISKKNLEDIDTGTRFSKEAAITLLGKAYLYQNKFQEAKQQFSLVINSGLYGLIDDLSDLYHVDANGCKEYILECVRHKDSANRGQGGWMGILCNWPFAYGFVAGPDSQKYYDFNATIGWSYFSPSKKLYDAYVAEEGVDGYRVTNWIKSWQQIVDMNIYTNSTLNLYGREGYFRLKWLSCKRDEDINFWYYGQSANTPVIRYADVLLMMAEASLNTGDQATADKCVNQVRNRARLDPKSNVTMKDIKTERELELSMEAIRYQDLKRWGDAPKELAYKGKKLPTFRIIPDATNDYSTIEGIYKAKYTTTLTFVDNERSIAGWTAGRDEFLPFPESELEVNHQLKQNPGY